ncbi:SpoIIE family protein phosphatase, partial [Kitasatospora sp. NPDC059571]|uniref:SpoIIE family protein phosphatase n=1 Tax=Kitasatospora sp. NPDC059571 TaxID=3346871 RepID=UPI0036B54196
GVLTAWAPGAERLLGHPSELAVGRPAADLLAAPPPPGALRALARAEEWRGRLLLRHRDGWSVAAEVRATPVRGAHGARAWVLAAEEPPEAAGGRGELGAWAFDQLPIGVAVYDSDARLVGANHEVLRIIEAREEAVLGLPMSTVVRMQPGLPHDRIEELMAQVLRTGETVRDESFVQVPGDARAHAWATVLYPLKDPDGRVRGVSVGGIDITGQHRARQRLAVVNAAAVRIGTTLDVARTAQELADVATEQFADFVSVDLLDSVFQGAGPFDRPGAPSGAGPDRPPAAERFAPSGSDGLPPSGRAAFRRAAQQSVLPGCPESTVEPGRTDHFTDDSPLARALVTGRATRHRVDDPDIRRWLAADPVRQAGVSAFGIHSFIVAPLLARGNTLGLTILVRHRTADVFDADDLLLAEEITARAALCVDNARRYTYERNTALALQRSMLPQRAPRHAAVDVASRYLPAGPRAGVGGDWFDVIPLSGARVALVVGDVVGHGIHASATMGRLRTAVRTLADIDMPPDELLTHLDDLVLRLDRELEPQDGDAGGDEGGTSGADIGATCLYAVYDPVARRCTLARAGHPGPAVVHPSGAVEFPELPAGPPLGLGGLPFESTELDLAEGSLIALFTDGLVESAGHDVDVGLGRLRRVLLTAGPSLERTCDDILAALLTGAPAADDVALLLARTRALDASQVATWEVPAEPAAVAASRRLAVEQLAAWGLEEVAFVTELVVSELVTNAIRYGRPPVQLRLIHDTSLICEVSDASSTAPHLRRARTFDEGGRGLLLVAQLTQAWGTRHTLHGKTIWAEQTLPSA